MSLKGELRRAGGESLFDALMLKKKLRIPIQFFPKNAKVVFSDANITVKSHKNSLQHNRLGVLVNKHVAKNATKRNYLRRRFLSLPHLQFAKIKIGESNDLLIILKPPIIKLTTKELTDLLVKYEQLI